MNIDLSLFQPRPYQQPIVNAWLDGYKRIIAVLPRRSGKDLLAFNIMLREAIKTPAVYMYCLPTFRQAKLVIWDSITNDGLRFLDYIPKELIANTNSQEMKIRLKNGSLIQLIGSDTYDTSLVGTNPRMVVFSEWSLSDPRAFDFVRPILNANQGIAMFLFCVSPETLVITKDGLKRIANVCALRETYNDLNKPIYGLGGFNNAEQFYYGGLQPTLKITLESGYEIECTKVHPLWNGSSWIKAGDLRIGDLLPVQYGQNVWGSGIDASEFKEPKHKGRIRRFDFNNLDKEFFYLLGLIHADGSYSNNTVTVTKKKDQQIIDVLNSHGFISNKDGYHHHLSSRTLCEFLEFLDFKHGARNKTFPEKFLSCTKEQMTAFLQGIFDGDGTSHSNKNKRGGIKLTSTCESFLKTLQIVLLNYGICSSIRSELKEPTKRVKVQSLIFNLEITGYFAYIFYRDIGFRLWRKQKNQYHVPLSCRDESGNIYPVDTTRLVDYKIPLSAVKNPSRMSRRTIATLNKKRPNNYLNTLLSEKLYYSPIAKIIDSQSQVYDFVIPVTNSFFSNGFLSHNTPRGKNHAYDLYQIALNNPDRWFAIRLTLDDTKHIPLEEIEREKAAGEMSEDMINQEYYTSFDLGVEGAYYAKYIDKARLEGRVTNVLYQPGHQVHSVWDLGFRDQTSIIMFQVIGPEIRIIDCYESSGKALDHYVKVLKEKDYLWGKHFFPHDVKVHELSTGMSRLQKLRELGIVGTELPMLPVEDGIELVRSHLPRCWFDQYKTIQLLKALENYRQEYDHKHKTYKGRPLHDFSSHFADAMRYLCMSLPHTTKGTTPEELERRYQKAMYGSDRLPGIFGQDQFNQGYY